MKKRLLKTIILSVLTLAIAGCGQSANNAATGNTNNATEVNEASPENTYQLCTG